MGATIEQIIATFPTDISDNPDIDVYVELAKTQTSSCFYGSRYNQAVALRAAHNLVLSNPETYVQYIGGGILSKKQGGVSVQYGGTAALNLIDNSGLTQTVYGKQLLALQRMSAPTIGAMGAGTICGGT